MGSLRGEGGEPWRLFVTVTVCLLTVEIITNGFAVRRHAGCETQARWGSRCDASDVGCVGGSSRVSPVVGGRLEDRGRSPIHDGQPRLAG